MKRLFTLFVLFLACEAAAQTYDDEYRPYDYPEEERPMLETDSALFYRAIQNSDDQYARLSLFNLPDVTIRRRGMSYDEEYTVLDGLPVHYRYTSILRRMGADELLTTGSSPLGDVSLGTGFVRRFTFTDALPLRGCRASVNFSGRNYLTGANFSIQDEGSRGMTYACAVDARTGRDLWIDGVFTHSVTAGVQLRKTFSREHTLSLLCILPPVMRGTRLASVDEAFTLTDNHLYNPSWGFQNGKVRNSRVRREFVPLVMAAYERRLSPVTRIEVSMGAELGVKKYSMPGWYEARTPMPDNYKYLPSYTRDPVSERLWRAGDPRYTQINWDEMILQNRMANGHAVYALEDRVERVTNLRAAVRATTQVEPRLKLSYGIGCSYELSRNYKNMRDLLGAEYITDIDRFLIDDATFSSLSENDLRHPQRRIGEGDRMGYDYRLHRRHVEVFLAAAYRSNRLRADVSAMLGSASVFRRGYMEKELFPGNGSFGTSRRMHFTPYMVKAAAGWAFTPQHYLELACAAGHRTPQAALLFVQPMYNNRTVDHPEAERCYSAEVNYKYVGRAVDLRLTAYVTALYDERISRRYFDDLSGQYCDLLVSGISRSAMGVEVAADVALSYRWHLALTASGGVYDYLRDPSVTVMTDTDNTLVDHKAVSHMKDCRPGDTPGFTASAELSHFARRGWGFRLSAGYVAGRYVDPSVVRRTDRVLRECGQSPELFDQWMSQERLDDVLTSRASVFKSFYFRRSRLTAYLMVSNLLGVEDAMAHGFESDRAQGLRSGDLKMWRPQPTRYTYAYPRLFYLSVSYQF